MVSERPSYEDLAAEVVELRWLVERLTVRLDALETENADLRRRLDMDSTNSSTPPSKDSIAAKAKQRADRSSRVRSKDRKPGGQPGRQGSGLMPASDPDRTRRVDPPSECQDCRADLSGAMELADGWAQVWDVLPAVLEKTHYELPRRRCGCGATTTAQPPFGRAGTVSYGPHLNTAAILLSREGNVPVERSAMLIDALLEVKVSTGFVARATERLADTLEQAAFDGAMRAALRAEDVLCGDESPVNVLRNDIDDTTGEQVAGTPHTVVLRTPDARLTWYAAMPSRSKDSIADLGVLKDGMASWCVTTTSAGTSSMCTWPGCNNAQRTSSATTRACSNCTRTGKNGPAQSSASCGRQRKQSRRPVPPTPANSTRNC